MPFFIFPRGMQNILYKNYHDTLTMERDNTTFAFLGKQKYQQNLVIHYKFNPLLISVAQGFIEV